MLRRFAVDHVKPHLSDEAWQKLRRLGGEREPTPTKPAASPPAPERKPEKTLSRQEMIDAIGRTSVEGLGANSTLPKGVRFVSPDPYHTTTPPPMTRHSFLTTIHEVLQPQAYFEIGIDQGQSLTLVRCPAIAVDPGFRINRTVHCDVHIFRETSDDFFALPDGFDHLGGKPVDLAFIDGMHLAEFALRDFMNTEKRMSPGGVIVLDDMIPRNSLEAYRIRRTSGWAGDVYKVHEVLRRYRPDLTLLPINTKPTGSYVIVGLDPDSTVLDDAYEQIEAEITAPDPQTVDPEWLARTEAHDPVALLDSPAWSRLRELRTAGATRQEYAEVWQTLADAPKG